MSTQWPDDTIQTPTVDNSLPPNAKLKRSDTSVHTTVNQDAEMKEISEGPPLKTETFINHCS